MVTHRGCTSISHLCHNVMKDSFTFFLRRSIYRFISLIEILGRRFGAFREPRMILLCYHSISDDAWRFSVSEEMFKRQVLWLKNNGYVFLTLQSVYDIVKGQLAMPQKAVALMFDDGYRDIMTIKDWLKREDIPASVFVLSDPRNAAQSEVCQGKLFLTKEDIGELMRLGWEIGNHSATHADFSKLTDDDIIREIHDAKQSLDTMLGIDTRWFAYPKGYYSPKVVDAVREAGYSLAFTMDDNSIDTSVDTMLIPRIGVDNSHTMSDFRGMISPAAVTFRKCVKALIPQGIINRLLGISK